MYPPKRDPGRPVGAARWWVQGQLGGPTREQESNPVVHSLTLTTIAPSNPDRVELVIVNNTSGNVFIGLSTQNVSIGQGIQLPANGGSVSIFLVDDYTLPAREWVAISTVDGFPIYVLEVISDVVLPQEPGA
jgi:hypothetical protein